MTEAADLPHALVLTAPTPSEWAISARSKVAAVVALSHIADDDTWVARTAIELAQKCPAHLWQLLVFTGDTARYAPHLGFAQRSARRKVRGYVLIDPQLPAPGVVSDWPDAPVTLILTDACPTADELAAAAALRGWTVMHGDPDDCLATLSAQP